MNHKQGIVRRNGITLGGWGISRPLGGGSVPPTIVSISPDELSQGVTDDVVITGTGFTSEAVISFGDGVTVNSRTVDSATQITANITVGIDAATGNRTVTVTEPSGSAELVDGFEVLFGFGNALAFDGVNDFVSLANTITVGNSNFSMSVWLKKTSGSNVIIPISNGSNRYLFFIAGTGYNCRIENTFSIRTFTSTAINNSWNHYFITKTSASNVDFYVNGIYINSWNIAGDCSGLTLTTIGATSFYAEGSIDELCFWLESGTQQNATDLYNNGAGRLATDIITNPELYLQFNETQGTTAVDSSENNNNGTLTNFNVDECPFDGENSCPWQPFNP